LKRAIFGKEDANDPIDQIKPNRYGRYFFDREDKVFRHILEYMRTGFLVIPDRIKSGIWNNELDYWGIGSDVCCLSEAEMDAILVAKVLIQKKIEKHAGEKRDDSDFEVCMHSKTCKDIPYKIQNVNSYALRYWNSTLIDVRCGIRYEETQGFWDWVWGRHYLILYVRIVGKNVWKTIAEQVRKERNNPKLTDDEIHSDTEYSYD